MQKKIFSFVSLVIAFVLSFGLMGLQPASASSDVAQSGGGSGTLTAQGKGIAWVRGNGTFTVSGSGVLRFRDWGGDAQVTVDGTQRNVFKGRWNRYAGFRGMATITGTDVMIELAGVNVNLTATGTGRYVLRGQGTYTKTISGTTTTSTGEWMTVTQTL
ncbi:MAG: hypothetical protein HC853_04770 [Anaerolineae bacterium]|nr:hypothetical protein [Anaerolineae bacterium]